MLSTNIKSTNIELTDAIVAAIEKKIATLDKYLAHIRPPKEARVVVEKTTRHHKKGMVFKVEVDLKLPGQKLHAESVSEKLYAAIDLAKDELKREINKTTKTRKERVIKGARVAKELRNNG